METRSSLGIAGAQGGTAVSSDLAAAFPAPDSAGYNNGPLYYFLGGAVMVLLLSTANVAALLLNRGMRRGREFALRSALGGRLSALARQLVAEGVDIVIPAGLLGLIAAHTVLRVVIAALPPDFLACGGAVSLDAHAVAFALSLSALTTLFSSLPRF